MFEVPSVAAATATAEPRRLSTPFGTIEGNAEAAAGFMTDSHSKLRSMETLAIWNSNNQVKTRFGSRDERAHFGDKSEKKSPAAPISGK